jgi:hypothetical protein
MQWNEESNSGGRITAKEMDDHQNDADYEQNMNQTARDMKRHPGDDPDDEQNKGQYQK